MSTGSLKINVIPGLISEFLYKTVYMFPTAPKKPNFVSPNGTIDVPVLTGLSVFCFIVMLFVCVNQCPYFKNILYNSAHKSWSNI